ncbi:hypothetical protein TNCV_11471 [Trichonephila clavipes]|nr:hypothetical protein TNCV_11471 [Trichonephila clavipes]
MPCRKSNLGRNTRKAKLVQRVIAHQSNNFERTYNGEDALIPDIPMIPTDMPFEFKRYQYPFRLVFAITINKAQGQPLDLCG